MPKYIVSAMIQAPANEPVSVNWYKGDDLARAISAMVGAAVHDRDVNDATPELPASVRYATLGVTLSIEQETAAGHGPCPVKDCTLALVTVNGLILQPMCPVHGQPDYDEVEDPFFDDYDTEPGGYALSDCTYWSRSDTDCAGPRIGTVMRRDTQRFVIVCEHHFNSPPTTP